MAEDVWTGDVSLDPAPPPGGFPLDEVLWPVESWLVMVTTDPDRLAINLSVVARSVTSIGGLDFQAAFATAELAGRAVAPSTRT